MQARPRKKAAGLSREDGHDSCVGADMRNLAISLSLALASQAFACSSDRGDDETDPSSSESALTEIGAGVEVARCWFETRLPTPAPFPSLGSASLKCKLVSSENADAAFVPGVLQIIAQHQSASSHQAIREKLIVNPAPAPESAESAMVLQPSGFPLEARFEALLHLPAATNRPLPPMQAVDGRGAFVSEGFRVASFAEAAGRGVDNPYIVKVPLTTWSLKLATPTATAAAPVTLAVASYSASIAPWSSSSDAQHRDSLSVQVRASSSGTCLPLRVLAPKDGAPLPVVITGLATEARGSIDGAGDYLIDASGALRRATAAEAAASACSPGRLGAPCNAGACTEGACVGGKCQDACGVAGQSCCGSASTPWAERCGANAFCRTASAECIECGIEAKTCCPNASGAPTICSGGLTCNSGYCARP